MNHQRRAVLAAATLLALAACGGGTQPAERSFSGTLSMGAPAGAGLAISEQIEEVRTTGPLRYVPGEVIVKFKPGVSLQSAERLSVGGVQLQGVRSLGLEGVELLRAEGAASVEGLVRGLKARGDVAWAQPNYLMQALAAPNDEFYPAHWHYPLVNLPQAWDTEKGSGSPVTVAVVDTGILSKHPDLQGKLLPGYDFITNPQNANDGNGRDADAEDPGDTPGGQSSYHGSHVAGTVAAATNNSLGVAGVSWGAKILPVRVLGVQGGSLADILDGVLWAAGIAVPGVPANPNPAQVINMSLGGDAVCADVPAYQEAFDKVIAKGTVVVVAAGNENKDAALTSPASCSGVITVGATQLSNQRTRYSNFGKRIDLMAPGGDTRQDLNNDQYPDGVLSLAKNDQTGELLYSFKNGTSMAAPHVAGVVALMKARKPGLTPAEALSVLKQTAKGLSAGACTGQGPAQTPADCGAGLMDAAAALNALSSSQPGPNPNPQPDFTLSLSPNSLALKPGGSATVSANLAPANGFNSQISLGLSGQPSGVVGTFSGTTLTLTTSPNLAPGSYGLTVTASGGGLTKTATLSLSVQSASAERPSLAGTLVLACYYIGNDCDSLRSQAFAVNSGVRSTNYSFKNLEPGKYLLLAWKDANKNEEVDNGDWTAIYTENGDLVLLEPPRANLGLSLELVMGTQSERVSPAVWRAFERAAKR